MKQRIVLLCVAVFVVFGLTLVTLRLVRIRPVAISQGSTTPQFQLLNEDEKPDNEESALSLTRQVLLSSPLMIFDRGTVTPFTPKAVITETNRQRMSHGLPPLVEDQLLNNAAEQKVRDLFERQYFDHISPTGEGPDVIIHRSGYEYVSVGENLALGTFGDEEALVAAWMQSPGHRANILRPQFQEIGLAVGRGEYNGKQVLIAVQEFGRPLSSCPMVSIRAKNEIDNDRTKLAALAKTLEIVRAEITALSVQENRDQARYTEKINLYNTQVTEYNVLTGLIKDKTTAYNAQVRAFNACLTSSL